MTAHVQDVDRQPVPRQGNDTHGVACQVVARVKGVGDAERASLEFGRRKQRLLHARRQPQVLFECFFRHPQRVFGEPAGRDVGLDADEVRHLP